MCPYFDRDYKKCLLFKTYPREDNIRRFCEECDRPYDECANYKWAKEINHGSVPPPYKYK